MIGDKITYKQHADSLRIFIRASSRGDKARTRNILQRLKFLLVGGVLLIPLVIISLSTDYRIWSLSLAAFWLILFARTFSIYKYRESGEEQLFVTNNLLRYNAVVKIFGLKFRIGRKHVTFPIEILVNPKPEIMNGLHGMEDDMNKVVSIADLGNRHVLKLRMEEKSGLELKNLILGFIGEVKPS
jgi:hypothetical protein